MLTNRVKLQYLKIKMVNKYTFPKFTPDKMKFSENSCVGFSSAG